MSPVFQYIYIYDLNCLTSDDSNNLTLFDAEMLLTLLGLGIVINTWRVDIYTGVGGRGGLEFKSLH